MVSLAAFRVWNQPSYPRPAILGARKTSRAVTNCNPARPLDASIPSVITSGWRTKVQKKNDPGPTRPHAKSSPWRLGVPPWRRTQNAYKRILSSPSATVSFKRPQHCRKEVNLPLGQNCQGKTEYMRRVGS